MNSQRKVFIGMALFTMCVCASVSAQTTQPVSLTGLNTVLNIAMAFFTSGYMKAILTLALGGTTMGLIMNRGEPGMVKKFIPLVVASAILLSLSALVGLIFVPDATQAANSTKYFNFQ